MRLGSYKPPYDVDFSAKERVILLSGHPNCDTQLLNLGTVSFAHVKAVRNKCLNLKIKIKFLLKYPVLHQAYMTQCHPLLTLISYCVILFSFTLMFIDNWFIYCAVALCVASVY